MNEWGRYAHGRAIEVVTREAGPPGNLMSRKALGPNGLQYRDARRFAFKGYEFADGMFFTFSRSD